MGFSIMLLMVDFTVFSPAIVLKSFKATLLAFFGLEKEQACLTKTPYVSDSVA